MLPDESMHKVQASYGPMSGHTRCVIMQSVLFLNDFFVLVFCLCFMYRFHYILESVY